MRVTDTLRIEGVLTIKCPKCGDGWELTLESAPPSKAITGLAMHLADMDEHACRSFEVLDGGLVPMLADADPGAGCGGGPTKAGELELLSFEQDESGD